MQTPRGGAWVGKDAHGGVVGGWGENKKRGFLTPLIFLTNINSEADQALDH